MRHTKNDKNLFLINRTRFYTKIFCGTDARVMFSEMKERETTTVSPFLLLKQSGTCGSPLPWSSIFVEFHRTHFENYGFRLLHGFFSTGNPVSRLTSFNPF